jgi:hypothetical protein
MKQAVVAGALAVAAVNVLAAALGMWIAYRGDPSHRTTTGAFWIVLRAAQGAALTLAIAVGSLAAAGKHASEGLFYLYALLPLVVSFLAEQLRVAAAQTVLDQRGLADAQAVGQLAQGEQHELVATIIRREVTVMAASAIVVVFLALRAAATAHGF